MSSDRLSDQQGQLRAWDTLRRPIWMFDPHRCCGVYANSAALKLWGAETLEELLARDFTQLSSAVRARTARLARDTADGGEVAEQWTFYPNGRPVTVQATISTCWLGADRPVLLFEASPLEVEAEERRAVEALRHTTTMITLLDELGRNLFTNPAAFSAYASDEDSPWRRFTDPEAAEVLSARALGGEPTSALCKMSTIEGERWHHVDARKVLDPVTGAAGVLLNEVDVTDRVEAEQAKVAAEHLASMSQVRERFLSDMSHELRTPLNAIIGFSELLKRSQLMPEQLDQVLRIHASGELLRTVVNDMIQVSGDERSPVQADGGGSPLPIPVEPASSPDFPVSQYEVSECDLRVLYVDDNAHNRALVSAILQAQGVDCTTAEDGDEGLLLAQEGNWDVILMDIQMPRMDGVQSTRAIRALPHPEGDRPIVAVTANTLPDQIDGYIRAGMDDCIAKPIAIEMLLDRVAFWSERSHARPADLHAERGSSKSNGFWVHAPSPCSQGDQLARSSSNAFMAAGTAR